MLAVFLYRIHSFGVKAAASVNRPKPCLDVPNVFLIFMTYFFHSLNTSLRNYMLVFSNFTASRNMIFEDSYSYTIFLSFYSKQVI